MQKTSPVILDADGILLPVRIELVETSGPVSPAFQYRTHIVLCTENNGIWLSCDDDREYRNGKPLQSIHLHKQLKRDDFTAVLHEVCKLECYRLGTNADFIGTARNRTGISFNYISVCMGTDIKFRIDYLLSSYDNDMFKLYRQVIEQLKKLAHSHADDSCVK